jgi:hypothetical protein
MTSERIYQLILLLLISFFISACRNNDKPFTPGYEWVYLVEDSEGNSLDTLYLSIEENIFADKINWFYSYDLSEEITTSVSSQRSFSVDSEVVDIPNPIGGNLNNIAPFGKIYLPLKDITDTIQSDHKVKMTNTKFDGQTINTSTYLDDEKTVIKFGKETTAYNYISESIVDNNIYIARYSYSKDVGLTEMKYIFPDGRLININLVSLTIDQEN